jgi:outer membrane receptor protein involved in Fe transport
MNTGGAASRWRGDLLAATILSCGLCIAGSAPSRADPADAPSATSPSSPLPVVRLAQAAPPSSPATTTPTPAKAPPPIEEVVVTASRNGAANVQNVPIAVSVLKPEALDAFGGTGLLDYTQTVPSLSIEDFGPGINKITIRGINTTGLDYTNVQDRPLVAVYLDETPISLQSQNPDLKVFDLSRVEVLRGPEGTLYGAGAMAGTIRLITQKPDPTSYFGSLEEVVSDTDGGYGGFNYSLRAMGNFPIVNDKLAVRVVLYRSDDSGFIKNIGIGKNTQDDVSDQARLALRLTPIENLTLDASLTYEHLDAGVYDAFAGLPAYTFKSLEPEETKDNFKVWNLTATYNLDFASATNSFSYLQRKNADYAANEYGVNSFLYVPFVGTGYPIAPALDVVRDNTSDVIDEFRLYSNGDRRLTWNAGIFYDKFTRDYYQDQPAKGFDAFWQYIVGYPGYSSLDDGAFNPNDDFSGIQDVNESQVALFAQATYKILENLEITAGWRYFDWHQNFNLYFGGIFGANPIAAGGVPGVPLTEQGKASATGNTPRFAIDYHVTPDTMLYAEAAKGFRYGGVNQPVPLSICGVYLAALGLKSAPLQFGPDELWSYSLGEKSTLFNNRLTLDVTGFLINWSHVQTEEALACSYYFDENLGNIQSKGVEVESSLQVTKYLTVNFNGSYTDSAADGALTAVQAPSGSPTPYSPRYIASLSANYRVPLERGGLEFGVEYNYRSSEQNAFSIPTGAAGDVCRTSAGIYGSGCGFRTFPDLHTLNAEVSYKIKGWTVGLFANNIGSFAKIVNIGAPPAGSQQPGDTIFYARPMTIGLRVKTTF